MAREYTTNQQRVQHQWDDCNNILLQELSRISNITGQCRCSSCIWGSQIDLTFLVSHSAREVPVRSWNTNLHNQHVGNGVNYSDSQSHHLCRKHIKATIWQMNNHSSHNKNITVLLTWTFRSTHLYNLQRSIELQDIKIACNTII